VTETHAITNNILYELLPVNYVISIALDESSLLMILDDIKSISATILPNDATEKTINWQSSDTSVAMVTTDGKVMAIGLGNATITATAQDGGGASATCTITVGQKATPTTSSAPTLKGDAINSGTIDILDLDSIIDYIVSNTSPASLANADANEDGKVDILDLVWIIDKIVGGS
jgi:uncharacterized protein YjdB